MPKMQNITLVFANMVLSESKVVHEYDNHQPEYELFNHSQHSNYYKSFKKKSSLCFFGKSLGKNNM